MNTQYKQIWVQVCTNGQQTYLWKTSILRGMSNPKHDAEVMRTENDINGEEANNLYAGPSEPGPPPPVLGWNISKKVFFK